jgi:cobalt-zinc-cadmium resistance protein CzcA
MSRGDDLPIVDAPRGIVERLVLWAVAQRSLVLLAALIVSAAGFWALVQLPIDAIPDITGTQVQINTMVPGLAPEEIEQRATIPLERIMAGQPGLTDMRSLTKSGLSQVTLIYADGTDVMRARQIVTERLTAVRDQLPPGATPMLAPITTGLGEIFYYTLDWQSPPGGLDGQQRLMELYEAQEYIVKPLVRGVAGVADVNSNGGLEKQFVIEPDLTKLAAAGLTAANLADAVAQNVENAGGGTVTRGTRRLVVRTEGRVTDAAQLAALPVKFAGGTQPLRIGDVATVAIGSAPRTGAATADGREVVLGTAMMLVGQNSREVARRIDAALPDIKAALPPGMVLNVQYNRADLVERTVTTVRKNLTEGALLVCLVLLVMLGNWRAAIIVALVIPISFLMASAGMLKLGVSGNLMSLGALDFGLVVDGAIVAVENALRRLAMAGGGGNTARRQQIIAEAIAQVVRPVAFGVAIITLVYVPVLSLGGVEGKMFRPMAITVMLALSSALVLTLTVVPALASWLLRPPADARPAFVVRGAARFYDPLLARALRRPVLVIVPAIILMGVAGLLFGRLGTEFTPKLDEGAITAMVYKPVGMSLEASLAAERATENALRQLPQITHVFSRIGTSEVATDPMPPNENDLYIFYKPQAEWPRGTGQPATKAELVRVIDAVQAKTVKGQTMLFAQPIEMRFNEMLEGTRADLSVKIYGADYDILERVAAQIQGVMKAMPGTAAAEFETQGRTRTLVVRADRGAMMRLGLGIGEVNRAIETGIAGHEAGAIIEDGHPHAVVIRLPEAARADSAAILALPLRVGANGMVPLGRVARIDDVRAVEPILRDDGKRRAALMVNLATRDIETYVADARARIAREVKLPPGYTVVFGGQFKQLEAARARLAIVVPATLLLIFGLVYFALGSLRQAAIVYSGIPFAVTGGVLALALRGMPFSITAAIGFIALSGVAMLNGLVLIDHLNILRRDGMALAQAVAQGARDRLRPVLSTALVASFGFVPMAIANGAGAEVQRPLATVVIGGIITSTLLTLVLLPALYEWVERRAPARGHVRQPGLRTAPAVAP